MTDNWSVPSLYDAIDALIGSVSQDELKKETEILLETLPVPSLEGSIISFPMETEQEKDFEKLGELHTLKGLLIYDDRKKVNYFKNLLIVLDVAINPNENECSRKYASSIIESLILVLEIIPSEIKKSFLLRLSTWAKIPEGVVPENWDIDGSDLGNDVLPKYSFPGEKRTILSTLLKLALYGETAAFLQTADQVREVRKSDTFSHVNIPTISFFSRKGGVGKTTMALACLLWYIEHSEKKVCVIDLDLSGPVWQYFLFPEPDRPRYFLNEFFNMPQHKQQSWLSFPTGATLFHLVTHCCETTNLPEFKKRVDLLTLADLPRSNRYLDLSFKKNSQGFYYFLGELLGVLQNHYGLVIIDNGPGFDILPIMAYILLNKIQHGCSVAVSTPAMPDLRGTFLELSDLKLLDNGCASPPHWIINKTDEAARLFFKNNQSVIQVASEIESYRRIIPERPIIRSFSDDSTIPIEEWMFDIDSDLLSFGYLLEQTFPKNIEDGLSQHGERKTISNSLKNFKSSRFFNEQFYKFAEKKLKRKLLP